MRRKRGRAGFHEEEEREGWVSYGRREGGLCVMKRKREKAGCHEEEEREGWVS